MSKIAAIIGRILLAMIFIVSGAGKLMDPVGTAQALAGWDCRAASQFPPGFSNWPPV